MKWSLGGAIALLLGLIVLRIAEASGIFPRLGIAWIASALVAAVIYFLICHRRAQQTLRRAATHDHLLCPDCLYDLRALDATDTCPECGRAYEHDAVRAQWLDAERRLKRK